MRRGEHQLVDGLESAHQGRQRFTIVDVVGALLEGALAACLGNGNLVDAGRVEFVVGPGHDGLGGVGEHAGEFI